MSFLSFFSQNEVNPSTNRNPKITNKGPTEPWEMCSLSFSLLLTDMPVKDIYLAIWNSDGFHCSCGWHEKRVFILDPNLKAPFIKWISFVKDVRPPNAVESALVTGLEDALTVSVTVNGMFSGYTISLIVMNGVSHRGLFKASWPPGETEPKERSPLTTQLFLHHS